MNSIAISVKIWMSKKAETQHKHKPHQIISYKFL